MPVKKQPDNYHHGNLREALIQAGLRSLQVQGVETLSLRKLAEQCGVSPAAHSQNKGSSARRHGECTSWWSSPAGANCRGYVGRDFAVGIGCHLCSLSLKTQPARPCRGRHIAAILKNLWIPADAKEWKRGKLNGKTTARV